MSIFGKIKDAIFGHMPTAAAPAQPSASPAATALSAPTPTTPAAAAPEIDVEQVLGNIAAWKGNPELNYKTSIIDLMKLLDLDWSLANRKELAQKGRSKARRANLPGGLFRAPAPWEARIEFARPYRGLRTLLRRKGRIRHSAA